MKICIIGANGFLGRNITLQCLEKKYDVLAVYNNRKNNIPTSCRTMKYCDLLKSNLRFDTIFLTVGSFKSTHEELIDANINVTQAISNKFKKQKIVFISSVNIYGFQKQIITTRTSFNNANIYGLSKIAGEFIVMNHPKYSIVRLTYLYGKGMNTNSFLPKIIQDAIEKKLITLYGRGLRKQDYLNVKDAAALCILAAQNNRNNVYLGATGYSITNQQIAKEIQVFIPGCKIKITNIIDKAQSYNFDVRATKKKLNWNPKHILQEGLKEMILK